MRTRSPTRKRGQVGLGARVVGGRPDAGEPERLHLQRRSEREEVEPLLRDVRGLRGRTEAEAVGDHAGVGRVRGELEPVAAARGLGAMSHSAPPLLTRKADWRSSAMSGSSVRVSLMPAPAAVHAVQPSSIRSPAAGSVGAPSMPRSDPRATSRMYVVGDPVGGQLRLPEEELGGEVVGHALEHRVVAAAQDDVPLAGLLGDDEAALLEPRGVGATDEEARDRGAGEQQHRERDAADQDAPRPDRLDLAATGRTADEGGDEAALAEGVRLDEVLLGGHPISP